MQVQDLPQNGRIARLIQLTRELVQSRSAGQTLRILQNSLPDPHESVASMLLSTRGLSLGHYRVVRARLPEESPDELSIWTKEAPDFVRCDGVLSTIIRRLEPQLAQDVDWSRDPYFHKIFREYASVLAVPIEGDHLTPSWLILLKKLPEQFTVSDMEEAVERVALAGALLENQTLAAELARANEQIDRDARQLGEIQRALLPASLPVVAGLEIQADYLPLGRAGGDLYDLFPLDGPCDEGTHVRAIPGRWCVFIGDIEGHGLAAAIVMAIVHAVLHAHPAGIARPASLLTHVNQQLCRKKIGDLATAFLGVYEPASRRLTYACAGHPAPLLRRAADGSIGALDAVASYPLGVFESETFEEADVQLERGDVLLLYTDGITEAQGTARDRFGADRLMCMFRDAGDQPAEVIDQLRQAVRAHEHGESAHDDQTLVAVRVLLDDPMEQPMSASRRRCEAPVPGSAN